MNLATDGFHLAEFNCALSQRGYTFEDIKPLHMNTTKTIDQIDASEIRKIEFHKNYIHPNRPVLIKGILEDTPAKDLWSLDYLQKRLGDFEIKVFDKKKEVKNSASIILPSSFVR